MNDFGLIAAILSPFFSSVSTIFKSGAAKILTPLPVVGIGGALGSLILFIISKVRGEKISLRKIELHKKDFIAIVAFRFLLGELSFTYGLSQTSAAKAIFFTKIEPYFVLLLGWLFLKEKIEPKQLALLFVHLSGAVLLSTGGNFITFGKAQRGDLFIIIAMALFAVSYPFGTRLAKNVGSMTSSALALGLSSLIVIPLMFAFTPLDVLSYSITGWTYLIAYVLLFNVLALTLWFSSLKTVKGWMVSALRYIGPILGAPVAYFLFKDTLSPVQIVGALIILVTSFIIAREHFRASKVSLPQPLEES